MGRVIQGPFQSPDIDGGAFGTDEPPVQENTLGAKLEKIFLLKEQLDALEEQVSEYKSAIDQLKFEIYKEMEEKDLEKIECAYGSGKAKIDAMPQVKDWEAFMSWVSEGKRFEMVERRVCKTPFRDMLTTDGTLPPGVDVYMKQTVEIRKKARRKK